MAVERERSAGSGRRELKQAEQEGRGGSSSSEAGGPDPVWASARRQAGRAQRQRCAVTEVTGYAAGAATVGPKQRHADDLSSGDSDR